MMVSPYEVYEKIKKIVGSPSDPFADARTKNVLAVAAAAFRKSSWTLALEEPGFVETALTLARLQAAGIPLAYIEGRVQFCGLELVVLPGVFIPRTETELLAEQIAETVAAENLQPDFRILDVGTGTGALALFLARKFPESRVVGIDKSPLAVKNAVLNARRLGITNFEVLKTSFESMAAGMEAPEFEVVVSNPPYIGEFEKRFLPREVSASEPGEALFGGYLGTDFYRLLFEKLPLVLKKGGLFFFELGFNQQKEIQKLARSYRYKISFIRDYAGVERGVWGRLDG